MPVSFDGNPLSAYTSTKGVGYRYDADALAFFARMPSQPTTWEKRAYDRFVRGCKALGVWTKIVDAAFLCGHVQALGIIGIKGALSPAWVGSGGTFVAGHGLSGGGTLKIDTGYKVPVGKQNAHAMGALVVSQATSVAMMGNDNTVIIPMLTGPNDAFVRMASAANASAVYQPASPTGMWTAIRTAAASMSLWRDADKVIASTLTSTTPDATNNIHVLGRSGASAVYYDQRVAFWFVAEDMVEADVASFNALVQEVCGYLAAATTALANPTPETRGVLAYMAEMSRQRPWLLGALDTDTWYVSSPDLFADIVSLTGETPAVMTTDWVDTATPGRAADVASQIAAIKAHAAAGGIVSVSHHSGNPVNGTLERAFDGTSGTGTTYDMTGSPLTACLSGGSKRTEWLAYCARISAWLNALVGDDGKPIPVMLRWFHEIDGIAFWWSAESSAIGISLWQDFVTQIRAAGVRNALFDFNVNVGGSFSRYPGNSYIDILSGDYYENGSATATGLSAANIGTLTDGATGRVKPRWYSEVGYQLAANADATVWSVKNGAVINDKWAISAGFAHWRYPWGPTTGQTNSADYVAMVASTKCITRSRMVNAYARGAALAA